MQLYLQPRVHFAFSEPTLHLLTTSSFPTYLQIYWARVIVYIAFLQIFWYGSKAALTIIQICRTQAEDVAKQN